MAAPSRLVLIGDSIRLSYQAAVAGHLAPHVATWGPEANCRSTDDIVDHLDDWIVSRVDVATVVHLNAGLHDLRRPTGPGGAAQVPPDRYRSNLERILTAIRAAGAKPIVATSTPVDDDRHAATMAQRREPPQRVAGDVDGYNRVLVEVCHTMDVPWHDLHGVIDADRVGHLDDDGVHLTRLGVTAAAAAVVAAVRPYFAEHPTAS